MSKLSEPSIKSAGYMSKTEREDLILLIASNALFGSTLSYYFHYFKG